MTALDNVNKCSTILSMAAGICDSLGSALDGDTDLNALDNKELSLALYGVAHLIREARDTVNEIPRAELKGVEA
ncbi:hypothetical protein [Crenobacter caeni]|uniref:DUF3077 domain-containing protein n=1 Tax=Crenobacter caeni TaxID=2705474 RepID=A0A6B2KUH3_9NEIS|nr:hypothetical protein [Crenobacter caeni]NDV13754.1 hypothetical protein [Crenobacter caeni]